MRLLAVIAIVLFAFSVPARADVIVVENEEQFAKLREWINKSRQGYLEASDAMAPCYQDRHLQCEKSMRAAIQNNLPSAIQNAATGLTYFLEPIRNNAFRYERAFSLLFLNALAQRRGATCGDFNREATFASSTGRQVTLADRLAAAKAEVGNRTHLPEYQMLVRVTTLLSPCVGRV